MPNPLARRAAVLLLAATAVVCAVVVPADLSLKRAGLVGGVPSLLGTVRDPRSRFPAGTHRLNVLVIGKDYNHDRKGMPYTRGARSDSLILLSLDLDRRTVSALSIPRDTFVVAPDGRQGKINGAYARGGAPLAMRTVGKLLGVMPDHAIALKVDAVRTVVDALGGVEVETRDRMKYDDNWGQLHIDLPKGKQHIDGAAAIGFTRFRKVNHGQAHSAEEGDDRRMARQQALLRAVAAAAKAKFADPRHWHEADDFLAAAWESVETDLAREQLLALAALFREVRPETIQTQTLATTDFRTGGVWYARPDRAKMAAQVDRLLR